jgi:hypothetical protein
MNYHREYKNEKGRIFSESYNKVRFASTQQYDYTIDIQVEMFIIAACFGLQATIIRQQLCSKRLQLLNLSNMDPY